MALKDSTARSYSQLCGIATPLDVIGDRWAALILRDLLLGPLRFGELAEGLPGIGTNTLAFHDETRLVARPTTWELRLTDGAFTVRAKGTDLTVIGGAPDDADLVIT